MDHLHKLAEAVHAHVGKPDALYRDQGLIIAVSQGPTAPQPVVYEVMFCLVLQGRKSTRLGDIRQAYGAGDGLVVFG